MTSKPLEEGSCHLWLEYLNQDMNGDEALDFFDKSPLPAKIRPLLMFAVAMPLIVIMRVVVHTMTDNKKLALNITTI